VTAQAQMQSAPRGAKKSDLQQDMDRLTRLIWNHQEAQRRGFPTLHQLHTMSTWTWPRFVEALDGLLEDPESGVYITSAGGLGYTWGLTEQDLRRCEARVEQLRQKRRALSRS